MLGILEQFGTENHTWGLDIVQNLCEFCRFFLSDFLAQNVIIPPSGFYAADSTHGYLVWETQFLIEFLKLNLSEKKKEKSI